jgi:hypothetical protein
MHLRPSHQNLPADSVVRQRVESTDEEASNGPNADAIATCTAMSDAPGGNLIIGVSCELHDESSSSSRGGSRRSRCSSCADRRVNDRRSGNRLVVSHHKVVFLQRISSDSRPPGTGGLARTGDARISGVGGNAAAGFPRLCVSFAGLVKTDRASRHGSSAVCDC